MKNAYTYLEIAGICTLFPKTLNTNNIMDIFSLDASTIEDLFDWSKENGYLVKSKDGVVFDFKNTTICDFSAINSPLSVLIFRYFENTGWDDISNTVEHIVQRLQEQQVSGSNIFSIVISLGDHISRSGYMEYAAIIYNMSVKYCQQFSLTRKSLLTCTLRVSKADFMRGSSPIETSELQHKVLSGVTDDSATADDALLMLYAGIEDHFMGAESEGYGLRERGLKCLKQFNSQEINNEAVPLIGWHIYLRGNFREAISYYESMILALENTKQAELSTLTYPPIIYSYMFLGEYQRAMILNEIIYNSALEHKDYTTAIFMHCIEGRIQVSSGNNETGLEVLYKALSESVQRKFVWGQYYTLCALCQMHLTAGQMDACYDDMRQMRSLANEYHIGRMYSSPFILDALCALEQLGYQPIPTMGYKSELERHMNGNNIHMKGVAFRHYAILEKKHGNISENILSLLQKSVELLKQSGNFFELGQSYIELVRVFVELGDMQEAKKYSSLAWDSFGINAHIFFPNELVDFVETSGINTDISVDIQTLQLELRYVFDIKKLAIILITQLGRILKVESGGFASVSNGRPVVIATQSISSQHSSSDQNQRMLGWMSCAVLKRKMICRFSPELEQNGLLVDFSREPRFMLCMPFPLSAEPKAVIYLESYYRTSVLSKNEKNQLEKFCDAVSPHIIDTLFYKSNAFSDTHHSTPLKETQSDSSKNFCTGVTEAMSGVSQRISLIARTELPVLFTGETGVGKEVYARELYSQSGRKGPFIAVNCGAIPDSLIESEMFGYERGSFTGASQSRKGYFEAADGGTIFLDEIGELSLSAQVKLLRVLQEKEIMRIGGTEPIRTDFRLIAATNRNLDISIKSGAFRNDLYFRLNVLPIEIPPLRKRRADIPVIAQFLINKHCTQLGINICSIDTPTMARLMEYDWPGNVRELENVIQRGILLAGNTGVFKLELDDKTLSRTLAQKESFSTLEEMEREYIKKVLRSCGGKLAGNGGAAAILGLKRTTLISRMEKLGIRP